MELTLIDVGQRPHGDIRRAAHSYEPTREAAMAAFGRMRARARIALVLMAVSASVGLAECAAIDELRETFSRWVEWLSPG
jgi:hypothetical protein